MGELQRVLREQDADVTTTLVTPERLGELLDLLAAGTISATAAKDVLAELATSDASARTIVERKGLGQVSDTAELEGAVAKVVAANPDLVAKYRGGKTGVLGALVGQVMRETGGRANPQVVRELLERQAGA
jgi:aspartyl-tRNA(Asn)/glutamyl-tRNA(Gln) amidotransferase subunit B